MVWIKTKNKIEKFYFRVKEIPEPLLNFNRPIQNNEIKVDDFKTLKQIYCHLPDISLQISLKIKSIEIIRITKDNKIHREKNQVYDSKLIALAEVGNIYIFNDILIKCGDSGKTTNKSAVLKIIN